MGKQDSIQAALTSSQEENLSAGLDEHPWVSSFGSLAPSVLPLAQGYRWAGSGHAMVDGVLETELLDGEKKENWDHVWSTTLSNCRAGP